MTETRKETDSFGSISVPKDKYWGAQTQRSLENFKIGNELMPKAIIRALGIIKLAAAKVNKSQGLIEVEIADAIIQASEEVISGKLNEHFPLVRDLLKTRWNSKTLLLAKTSHQDIRSVENKGEF